MPEIKEEDNHSRRQEIPGMNLTLLSFNNKQDEYYLLAALSTTAPPDSLGNWLIDSGASRHFTGYKEALYNLIEKETNRKLFLEIIQNIL